MVFALLGLPSSVVGTVAVELFSNTLPVHIALLAVAL